MYDARKNSSDFQVKKFRIILCPSSSSSTTTVDNYSNNTSIITTNGGFDGSSCTKVRELGKERVGDLLNKSLRRIVIRRKKRRKLSAIIANKKPMSSLLATEAISAFVPPSAASSESSSPNSTGERTLGVLVVDEEEMNPSSPTISHGLISVIGRRRSMEDAVTVVPSLVHVSSSTDLAQAAPSSSTTTFDFFAVYDGHGGYSVANRCKERMHLLVAAEITAELERLEATSQSQSQSQRQFEVDWARVMRTSYARMDEEVAPEAGDEAAVGSTALVVVVGKEEVVVANCGDCRAVLGFSGGAALPLSRDHKPERPDEKERVEAAGGNVVNWDCSRVLGVLATSRSIGDYYLKPYVSAEPEVTVHKRSVSDEFLIIASDGLWDVVPNELACELVSKCFRGQVRRNVYDALSGNCAAAAATVLAELALARGSRDNISVIVVELQRSLSSSSTSTSAASSP